MGCTPVQGQRPTEDDSSTDRGRVSWSKVDTSPAGPRLESVLVHDQSTDRFLVFGGRDVDWNILDQTWQFDVDSRAWSQIETSHSPGGRFMHNMVYDRCNGRVILFGGFDGETSLGDLWSFDPELNTWGELDAVDGPPPRQLHAMAFDSVGNRLIVFGGRFQRGRELRQYGDTWVFDFDTGIWLEASPEVSPSPRDHAAMVFDRSAGVAVLFGGDASGTSQNDTWVYDPRANRWTAVEPANPPSGRDHHLLAFHPSSESVLLVGGRLEDNGIYRYSHASASWSKMEPTGTSPRFGDHMLGALGGDHLVLFGGFRGGAHPLGDTWLLDFDWD
ncbi:MAG: kelch repeat-containing protein [Candidatus Latescibacterota bacterium]